jgi:ribonuclease VapC
MGRGSLRAVVDTSVVIAYLLEEAGGDWLDKAVDAGSVMSEFNLAEVVRRQMRDGVTLENAMRVAINIGLDFVPFNQTIIAEMTKIFPFERRANLSLADCACLATARHLNLPALTADKDWAKIAGDVGVEVVVVR